jgi:ketosteroid isomerase-like protein
MTPEQEAVLEANKNFYRAVQSLNMEEMDAVWLQDDSVRCIHPGWDLLEGWEAIRESWQRIFEGTRYLKLSVSLQALRVEGPVAWVACTEKISSASEGVFENALVQSTNIFVEQDGNWLLVHHHASHMPASGQPQQGERLQ